MPIVPFRARPDEAAETPPPRPFDQAELDRLYWHTDTPVAEIAATFGLNRTKLGTIATPLPTERRCLLCGGVGVVPNRSRRSAEWIVCGDCGAAVRQHDRRRTDLSWSRATDTSPELRLVRMPVAIVREPLDGDRVRLGHRAQFAVDALERHGYSLEPDTLVSTVGHLAGLDELLAVLGAASDGPTVVGVTSLRTLGATQAEALANLVTITSAGWRVASGTDLEIQSVVGFHQVRSSLDREYRFRQSEWIDDRPGPDGLRFADHLVNATTDRPS